MTKSPWSLLITKSSHTFICLYLLPRWAAAVTGVLGQTSPCSGPEEHLSSQMLLSCKLSAVTPLIHMTTHSSRQVLQLVCVSMELSALLPEIHFPKASMPSIYYVQKAWWDPSLYSNSCERSRSAKAVFLPHLRLWWQTDIGFRLPCLYYQKLFLFITSPAWLDWKPFLYELRLTYRFCSLLHLTRF